jgi:DNA repair protein RadA/Sms
MKSFSKYVCQNCANEFAQWFGRCPNCGEWNSLVETVIAETKQKKTSRSKTTLAQPQKLSTINSVHFDRLSSTIKEFDRVLGGGIVPGSVTLLAGDPGIGKSTILLQVAASLGGLYVSGEESIQQIKIRADRLKIKSDKLMVLSEIDADLIVETILEQKPKIVVVDSIQTMTTDDLTGVAGSVGQVKECAARLLRVAKDNHIPLFLVGHVTKEGTIAGPKVLEHLVDTVLYLEGERFHTFRLLRSNKNRFGPTDEVGVFEMDETGMHQVLNPSELFLSENVSNIPGSAVVVTMEGTRPVLVEIQALVSPTPYGLPRRTVSGVDLNRVQLLLAVLSRRTKGLSGKSLSQLQNFDVYVNVAGGMKVAEPAADLGVCLAIASSFYNKSLKKGLVCIGEVGLLGEIRRIGNLKRRLAEAHSLGYKVKITPETARTLQEGLIQALS